MTEHTDTLYRTSNHPTTVVEGSFDFSFLTNSQENHQQKVVFWGLDSCKDLMAVKFSCEWSLPGGDLVEDRYGVLKKIIKEEAGWWVKREWIDEMRYFLDKLEIGFDTLEREHDPSKADSGYSLTPAEHPNGSKEP